MRRPSGAAPCSGGQALAVHVPQHACPALALPCPPTHAHMHSISISISSQPMLASSGLPPCAPQAAIYQLPDAAVQAGADWGALRQVRTLSNTAELAAALCMCIACTHAV